ncbi:MAG TPA: diacylglycerol kinase family protein [Gemmatimonadaceae bacterium]|nr:diacylglycerol kinase family protein [Gemmatimonadaceae bacterium]
MIPAFVNDAAGTAPAAKRALEEAGGFEIHAIPPNALESSIRSAMASKPARIAVAGGDGTVGTAARVLCGTDTALAVLPGGTLNHFARDHGIPIDPQQAAAIAIDGEIGRADVAYVDEYLFLNTSSVGAYVAYVRLRKRVQRYVGYRIASLLAALRMFISMRSVMLELDVKGERRIYSTPIVFIGVGERETRSPTLGNRVAGGRQCLHVIVVRERRAARLLVVALDAATRGLDSVAHTPELDSFMVDSCTIRMGGRQHHVAIDGEIVMLGMPLQYRLSKDALRIVVPAEPAKSAA